MHSYSDQPATRCKHRKLADRYIAIFTFAFAHMMFIYFVVFLLMLLNIFHQEWIILRHLTAYNVMSLVIRTADNTSL